MLRPFRFIGAERAGVYREPQANTLTDKPLHCRL